MSQYDVLNWLSDQRLVAPDKCFSLTDIAHAVDMDVSNCRRKIAGLVKCGYVEEFNGSRHRQFVYRVSDKAFENITGMRLEEVQA